MSASLHNSANPPSTDALEPADVDLVRQALASVLASAEFQPSERLRSFLQFIVEETLAGRADGLKEFTIGAEVCHRGTDYDPRVDPVVRVEARRLRARLEHYYAHEGVGAAVRIEIPKGGYVPVFHRQAVTPAVPDAPVETAPAAAPAAPAPRRRPRVALMAVASLTVAAVAWFASWRATDAPYASLRGIAVLPFENASAEPSNDYFAFGLTEDVTAHLARIDGLRVVARSSSERFRGPHDAGDVARQLRVRYLLEGSVRHAATRMRITAQLVDAATGATVWGEAFDRDAGDVFGVQDDISEAIASTLVTRLALAAPPRLATRAVIGSDAYERFLKGQFLNQTAVTPEGRARAIGLLEEAIARDARYAPAHLELAVARATEALQDASPSGPLVLQAEASIARALALEPSSAEALALRAWLTFFVSWDRAGAEQGFRDALRLNPSSPTAHHRYALLLMTARRFPEAVEHADRALDLDPLSHRVATNRAVVLFCARRYRDAEAQARAALELSPGYPLAHVLLGSSLAAQGRVTEAEAAYHAALSAQPGEPDATASLARLLASTGRREAARDLLRSMDVTPGAGTAPHASRYQRAFVHAALGEPDRALALLDEAIAAHETELVYLDVDPLFDALRTAGGFPERLARIRITAH